MLAVITAPRGHKRLLGIVSDTLERASRPHVVSLVNGGVAVLLMARDAADLIDVLDDALHGVAKIAIGVSGSIPQTTAARGVAPAELAAAAARHEQRRIGWFDDLTLGAVLFLRGGPVTCLDPGPPGPGRAGARLDPARDGPGGVAGGLPAAQRVVGGGRPCAGRAPAHAALPHLPGRRAHGAISGRG